MKNDYRLLGIKGLGQGPCNCWFADIEDESLEFNLSEGCRGHVVERD